MTADQQSLLALEGLMNEFFAAATTNNRKHEIENVLNNFGQQRGAWKQCLYYMSHTNNSYVSMYCLTTLENIINKQWVGLAAEERTEIRSTLYRIVLENHGAAPYYIRNKLVKLVVDIARLSWPHFYPDFFTNVLGLARSPDTVVLCVVFLQTISEELACPREELSYSRRTELRRLLSQQVPTMLTLLSGLLEGVVEKHRNGVTATPPPSPTHNSAPSPSRCVLSSSPIQTGSLLSSMFHGVEGSCSRIMWLLPPLDHESEVIAALSLNCLTHLFSWIPLSALITPRLLNTIFLFASLGADPQHTKSHSSSLDNKISCSDSLGVLAMGAVNEIMSKNCVPHDFEEFLLQMFRNTFHLLQRLVQDEPNATSRLQHLETSYIDKFSEFLRLFVSVHLRRFEDNSQFPVLEFLGLLFRYTFRQPTVEAYFNCLEVWGIFLDHLASKCQQNGDSKHVERYKDALMSLARALLHKIQLRHNQAELEELDHEISDAVLECGNSADINEIGKNDDLSEWHSFFSQNMELLAKIAELLPDQIFSLVYEPWSDAAKIYMSLQSNMSEQNGRRRLNISAEHECPRLHCLLRDLSSLLQALGRLSTLFLGEDLPKRCSMAISVVERLVQMANYSSGLKLYEVETAVEVLHSDFVEVHANIVSTLRAWVHWLSQLYGQQFVQVYPGGTQQHQHEDTCNRINKQMIVVATNSLNVGVPALIVNCGVHLLLSLSVLVRSPVALEVSSVQMLYTHGQAISSNMKVRRLLYRALVNFLLLPWPSFIVDHRMDTRRQYLSNFVNTLTSDIRKLNPQALADDKSLQSNSAAKICETLSFLQCQIEELSSTDKMSRELYYHCVQDVIHQSILLFPIYVHVPDVCEEILGLIVVVMQVLRVQLGAGRVEATIQMFLDVFTRDHLHLAITLDQPPAVRVIEKFLKLLELVVSEPGQSFKRFIPNTIALCMDHIYPLVAERASPEVKAPLFELLRCLLEHNWRYFFRPCVHKSLGAAGGESIDNEAQFVQIMQAIGQSFMQADITIFKHNLEALECLNSKYKLYHKMAFRSTMLGQFITVLLQVLVHKSQDLLQEEVTITVYNMAAVDFNTFFTAFVPHFLQNIDGLDDNQRATLRDNFKTDTDLPTFTQNVQRFVNDLRYYRTCNASLPSGSIKL